MAVSPKEHLRSRLFSDTHNYPRGFRRSGDFSIKEADALEQFGNLIIALENQEIEPCDDEDTHIIAVLRGETEAQTVAMKAWKKYIARINRPKLGSIYGSKLNDTEIDDSPVDDISDTDITPSTEEPE